MLSNETVSFIKHRLGNRCTDEFIEYLNNIGFDTCPAAKSHHGNYEGGLYDHSLEVATQLAILTVKLDLEWSCPESPWVVGFLHDICKTNDYKYNFAINNKIEYAPTQDGHGSKSVEMLQDKFPLTIEEAMCIRYHMGAFTDKSEWGDYSKAVKDYPNVLYTHTADMIASQIKGV